MERERKEVGMILKGIGVFIFFFVEVLLCLWFCFSLFLGVELDYCNV